MRSTQRLLLSAAMFATTFADRATAVLVLPIVPPPVTVTVTAVREVRVEQTAPAPAPRPTPDPLACPVLPAESGPAIGVPVSVRDEVASDDVAIVAAAAAAAPVIAVRDVDGSVRASDDDGATFHRVFGGRHVDELAIDGAGTLYVRSGGALGSRDAASRRETWRATPFGGGRIAALASRLVWFHDERVAVTRDRGATWQTIETDAPWTPETDGRVFAWNGAIYQVLHYWDRCGVDDWPVWRLAGKHVGHAIFHEGYGDDDTFEAADDVATTWRWRAHCPGCGHPGDTKALAAQKLAPVEGARTLAVYQRALIELCPNGARQIYRAFPLTAIAAVDSAGRPLVVVGRAIARWSPVHGWRRLLALPQRAAS